MEIIFNKVNVNIDQLTEEIKTSEITIAIDYIVQLGPILKIVFKSNISSLEQDILSSIVDNHIAQITQQMDVKISEMPAITSKRLVSNGNIKNLFKRVHGIRQLLVVAGPEQEQENIITFSAPYPWSKFLGVEFFASSMGDYCSLEVFDDALGTYTGIPNQKLNQFGFYANIAKDYYMHRSEFDADIYLGMVIKFSYFTKVANTIGINIILNEVKDIN
jgi:hypothetical protein